MSNGWPLVPLGRILTRSSETVAIQPDIVYRQVTVRLWGKGVTLRSEVPGSAIAADRQAVARAGQFILSRIDARNGAFGLVPTTLDGAVVSNDFPLFMLDPALVHPSFLEWMSKTHAFVDLCKAASEGTTNRVRLKEDRFLATEIPLPPLPEQQRIVARIEELAGKIEEARGLRREAMGEAEALLSSESGAVFHNLDEAYGRCAFDSYHPHVTSGPRNWGALYAVEGFRFYRAQDIGRYGCVEAESKVYIEPPEGEQGRTAKLRTGDLMLVITGATVGRCALFMEENEPGYVSQHVAICRFPEGAVQPDYLLWGLRSPLGQSQILGQRYGQGKPGLNLTNIRNLRLPMPPIAEQRRVVAYLDSLQAQVDALKRLQVETTVELDAMLPAVLDRAFKGEL